MPPSARLIVERHRLALVAPLRTARGPIAHRDVFVLRLEAGGILGLGESSPLPLAGTEGVAATEDALRIARTLLADGILPLDPPGAWEEALLGALPGTPAARHGVDLALWDWSARRRGLPLSALLGPGSAASVRVNALLSGEDLAASARAAAGYSVLKVKVGARPLEEDVRRVAAVRRAAPDCRLRLDANGVWPRSRDALAALEAIGLEGVDSVEQPVPAHDRLGLRWLRGRLPVSVAADEAVLDERTGLLLLEEEAVDALVLKPMKLGGLGPCLRLAREAGSRGIRCWLTTTIDGAVARLGALHLAAAIDPDGREAHGLATASLLAEDLGGRSSEASTSASRHRLLVAPEQVEGGMLTVPTGAGLGLNLDP